MWTKPIAVAETGLFLRQATAIWSDEERAGFVDFIAHNPEAGDVIQDTGGVRKVRWGRQGSGKRGGVRVIYFYYHLNTPVYLLMVYAKSSREDLSPNDKRAVQELTTRLKQNYRGKRRL